MLFQGLIYLHATVTALQPRRSLTRNVETLGQFARVPDLGGAPHVDDGGELAALYGRLQLLEADFCKKLTARLFGGVYTVYG